MFPLWFLVGKWKSNFQTALMGAHASSTRGGVIPSQIESFLERCLSRKQVGFMSLWFCLSVLLLEFRDGQQAARYVFCDAEEKGVVLLRMNFRTRGWSAGFLSWLIVVDLNGILRNNSRTLVEFESTSKRDTEWQRAIAFPIMKQLKVFGDKIV